MTKTKSENSTKEQSLKEFYSKLDKSLKGLYSGIDKASSVKFEYAVTNSYFTVIGKIKAKKFLSSDFIKEVVQEALRGMESLKKLETIIVIRKNRD